MDTKQSKNQLSITLPADLAEWLGRQAELRSLTAAELIVEAIQHYRDSSFEASPQIVGHILEPLFAPATRPHDEAISVQLPQQSGRLIAVKLKGVQPHAACDTIHLLGG